uniref:Polyketide synthase n=1 Tax=Paecilomyces divaricatus TaxID=644132 RepID=A0A3G1IHJ5_PAEDI|nr:polyketide synthase [Paecilomyces divaricatus]
MVENVSSPSSPRTSSPSGSCTPTSATSVGSDDKSMPIAVVGMSFRGPRDAISVESLWRMISEGREGWSKIPKSRWNNDAFYHPDHSRHGTINVEGGHFLEEDLARFDAPFFNMTNAEAAALDPQQRLLLESTFEAVENAGIPLDKMLGSKTSCFVGSFCGDYTDMLVRDPEAIPMYQCTNAGQSRAITANRVSYFFDLRGPSVTVDTACSGSLVALHLACQSLRTGDAKMAIVSGVNTILSHEFMSTMSMMRFLSPDGRCYTFDERANGYARGEGVGCLLLKPLSDALRDNDTIRAVIRGTGSNQDGKTSGITLPNANAQQELIRDVYAAAGLDPLETEYVECHGTGTQAGDPLETGAVAKVFSPGRPDDRPLRIGSIKTNVGHLEGASGIAGVIKAVLTLENQCFLPNRNFKSINPRIPLKEWKLKIQLENERWETVGPHRVSVNSFGYGGSNAHAVLEDTKGYLEQRSLTGSFRRVRALPHAATDLEPVSDPGSGPERTRLFVLSSFDQASGQQQIDQLREYLEQNSSRIDDQYLADLAYTLGERRSPFLWKTAMPASSVSSLVEGLKTRAKVSRAEKKKPTLGFIFTGQGAQWCGMGRELLAAYPVFASSVDAIATYLKSLGAPFDVREELVRDPKDSKINQPLYSQPICTAVQIALVDLLTFWGIRPASVTGHSSGELAGAYTAGALSMEHSMAAAYYRGVASSDLPRDHTQRGAMMAVGASKDAIQPRLSSLTTGTAVVACVNSPSSVTISGDASAVDELHGLLEKDQVFARKLAVDVAYHSHHMKAVADQYRTAMAAAGVTAVQPESTEPEVEFFSSVTGEKASLTDLGIEYWVANLLSQVKFADSVHRLCMETSASGRARKTKTKAPKRSGANNKAKVDMLVEIGPHSTLAGPIRQILGADQTLEQASIRYASALLRKSSAVDTTLTLASTLLMAGYPIDMAAINRPSDHHRVGVLVDLPPYPWNHSGSYWAEPRLSKAYRNRAHPRNDLLGVLDTHSSPREPRWRNYLRTSEIPWIKDHMIQSNVVYPAAGYLTMAVEAIGQRIGDNFPGHRISGYRLRDVAIEAALVISDDSEPEVMLSLRPSGDSGLVPAERWHEFHVLSVTPDNRWTEHCRGLICAEVAAMDGDEDDRGAEAGLTAETERWIEEAEQLCQKDVDIPRFYAELTGLGLEYGETFANMTRARSASHVCLAEIEVADTAAVMPLGFQSPFVVHPSTLDSLFHPLFVALSSDESLQDPAVPVAIEEIWIRHGMAKEAGHKFQVCASTQETGRDRIQAAISVVDAQRARSGPALTVRGLTCQFLDRASGDVEGDEQPTRLAYELHWEADVDLLSSSDLATLCAVGRPRDVGEKVARYVKLLGHKNPHLAILEVGAGQGELCIPVFRALAGEANSTPSFQSYTLADTEPGLSETIATIADQFDERADLIQYKELDISSDPLQQGFNAHSLDLILLPSRGVSATLRSKILKHAHQLLTPEGRLIVVDTRDLQEWWQALRESNFTDPEVIHDSPSETEADISVLVSKPQPQPRDQTPSDPPDVLVIAENQDSGVSIEHLQRLLADAHVPATVTDFAHADPEGKTCIVLSELTTSLLSHPDQHSFETLKRILVAGGRGVLWVVRGATGPAPTSSLATGLLRTIRSETDDDRPIVSLDLDASHPLSAESAAQSIFSAFRHRFVSPGGSHEVEYAERDGILRIPRVVESSLVNHEIVSSLRPAVAEDQPFFQPGRPLELTVGTPGRLDSLYYVDRSCISELPSDYVEIEVKAIGLGNGDVKTALGHDDAATRLGAECSGVVTALGDAVSGFKIGDRVAGFGAGTVATLYRDQAARFQLIPDDMSFARAAALPVAYITAFFAVHALGQVSRGDRVLIQDAGTAAGQALLELCALAGGDIIAVVDSPSQRAFLVGEYDLPASRILVGLRGRRLATSVMTLTRGCGVDAIFNFRGGEERRLCWSCVAPYGRFIDLGGGPSDLTDMPQLEMASFFSKNASFTALDFHYLVTQKPQAVHRIWSDVMALVRAKAIRGPPRLQLHSVSEVETALKQSQDGCDVEKVVIRAERDTIVQAIPPPKGDLLRADASYVLVGGLGGIGRAMASWMIANGARHLIFVNRSGLARNEARETVESLEGHGAHVAVYSCDVSDRDQVAQMVAQSSKEMPPIRGVIQAAMILRDMLFEKMSVDDFNTVLQPKWQGTWNLHGLLPRDMDFFIMLSSISGVIGNATQAAYAAGSTFLGAFAQYRSSLGLPAVTLDLGVITGIGYLSEHEELLQGMQRQGFEGTNEQTLMALIRSAIVSPRRTGSQAEIVTGLGTWREGVSLGNFDQPLFAHFRRQALGLRDATAEGPGTSVRESLRGCKTLDDAVALVCAALIDRLASRLNTPVDNIDSQRAMSEYGVDSLVAVEMRNWIGKEMESTMPILELLANQSISQLSEKIAQRSKVVAVSGSEE